MIPWCCTSRSTRLRAPSLPGHVMRDALNSPRHPNFGQTAAFGVTTVKIFSKHPQVGGWRSGDESTCKGAAGFDYYYGVRWGPASTPGGAPPDFAGDGPRIVELPRYRVLERCNRCSPPHHRVSFAWRWLGQQPRRLWCQKIGVSEARGLGRLAVLLVLLVLLALVLSVSGRHGGAAVPFVAPGL